MRFHRNELASKTILDSLRNCRVGVTVKGLTDIDPGRIADLIAEEFSETIHVSIVGYEFTPPQREITLVPDVESAVAWRSTPGLAGRILVFVQGEVPKLHSLQDLDTLTSRDLAKYLLQLALEDPNNNQPQVKFWEALIQESANFPLKMVEDFVASVYDEQDRNDAIPANLWRLGLLRDDAVLNSDIDPLERIKKNRELLVEIGHLSEKSRQRIGSVLSRTEGELQNRMRRAYEAVKDFFRRGGTESLKRLDVSTVETLIKAGRPIPTNPRPVNGSSGTNPPVGNSGDPGSENPPPPPDRPIRGRDLDDEIARNVVQRNREESLRQLGELIRQRFQDPQQPSDPISIDQGFNGRTLQPELPPKDIYEFIGFACGSDRWGGIFNTSRLEIKDAVRRATLQDVIPYNPNDPAQGIAGQCLFSLLRRFDSKLGITQFSPAIDKLIENREKLLEYLDLLISYPFVLFGGYPEIRLALNEYLIAYSDILRLFRLHEGTLYAQDPEPIRFVATELLRLEVIHIKTPNEWKAVLTPLHPFHLWRFRELINTIYNDSETFGQEEQDQLAKVLSNLPHLLHFLVFSPDVTRGEDIVLPQSGNLGLLPTYENHTNRYLGSDGIDFLKDLLRRWVEYAPYSKPQIRLGLVDIPDLPLALNIVTEYLKANRSSRFVVNAYFTHTHNALGDLTWLDYQGDDHELADYLRSGRLAIHIQSCNNIQEVAQRLESNPVHIAYLFDQSQYNVRYAPRARQLLVSPLVISYQYEYSETFNRGTISPSSEAEEGLFSDFHFLVQRAVNSPPGQQLRLQYQPDMELGPINSLLQRGATRWLAIADRVLTSYAPEEAVPLGENRIGQREIAVWAGASSRVVNQFIDLLGRFNLRPDPNSVATLLRRFGHIAAGGMVSLPSPGGNTGARESRLKGLLGTVLAAAWYLKKYPDALIATLDSDLARQWLKARKQSNERADLIGLRLDENGDLILEPIEVKTRSDNAETTIERDSVTGQRVLRGAAVDQVLAIQDAINPIFGGEDQQPIFTPARREVLKYQLYRECFREVHNPEWQKDWFYRLNDAFQVPAPRIPVIVKGLIIHVKLEEVGDTTYISDELKPLILVTLGTTAIQRLVSATSDENNANNTGHDDNDSENAVLDPIITSSEITTGGIGYEHGQTPSPAQNSQADVEETTLPLIAEVNSPNVYSTQEVQNDSSDPNEAIELSRLFLRACQSYRIDIQECDPHRAVIGPNVLRFYVRLLPGQRFEQFKNALEDIGREMRRSGLLIRQIPNSDEIALDIPRASRETVPLTRGLAVLPRVASLEQLPIPIGVTPEGQDIIRDLGRMPHLLVGGTTGAGKTIFLYGILVSLITSHPEPGSLRLMLSTSKPEDFVFFEGLPHLETGRVIADAGEAVNYLQNEIRNVFEERLSLLTNARCRDIVEYNLRHETPLPPLVVVVDEFADLADQLGTNRVAKDAFYTNIRRIAQLGRNRGVHLVLCTQRPSANLVPTDIRNLMNARVSLRVNDAIASRMILEEVGGENLQMYGDLLFKEQAIITRAQGYYVTSDELDNLLAPLR